MKQKLDQFVAEFQRMTYRDNQSGFFVGQTKCGKAICGEVIDEKRLVPGLKYEFFGTWVSHPAFGRQFRFDTFRIVTPLQRNEVCLYLQKYGKGIGPKTANQIFDAFGSESIITLRSNPSAVADRIERLSNEQAKEIAKALDQVVGSEEARARLMQMYSESKIPISCIEDTLAKLGAAAVAKIEENPYCLLDHRVNRIGFKSADKLYLDLGKDPAAAERQARCLHNILESDRSGSTWRHIDSIRQEYYTAMREFAVSFDLAIEECETMGLLIVKDNMVALESESSMEDRICKRFVDLLTKPVEIRSSRRVMQREYRPRARRRIDHA
jgi:ribosomal protein S13